MPIENCAKVIFMPSPFAAEQTNRFDDEFIMAAEKDHRDKFAFLGGGGTLNVMIQQSVESGDAGPEVLKKFKDRAEQIMKDGASGFGEMTPEHFAMNANGFYEYAPADHPLFLALIDISAEHGGAPISVHMEAVSKAMPIPPELASFHNNAPQLHANIPAFERLLAKSSRKYCLGPRGLGQHRRSHRRAQPPPAESPSQSLHGDQDRSRRAWKELHP